MGRKMREDLKPNNPHYISTYRRKELKYFCLQYYEWKKEVLSYKQTHVQDEWTDDTGDTAIEHVQSKKKMELVEEISKKAGGDISDYIFKSVTENLSYADMRAKYYIPCGRDYFYERLHKFYFLLSQEKHTF